jgi:Cu-Zn family superoxide dismutase
LLNPPLPSYTSHLGEFTYLRGTKPAAIANVVGSGQFPNIHGSVRFYQTQYGTLVTTEIFGLPCTGDRDVFGLYINDMAGCFDNRLNGVGGNVRYNPDNSPVGTRQGELAPLYCNGGYAYGEQLSSRFRLGDIVGHSVVIADAPDEYSGGGRRNYNLACGIIGRA